MTDLISKNADAARAADLVRAEPNSRQTCWHWQHERLTHSDECLTDESNPESIWTHAEHFYPGTERGSDRSCQGCEPESLKSTIHFIYFLQKKKKEEKYYKVNNWTKDFFQNFIRTDVEEFFLWSYLSREKLTLGREISLVKLREENIFFKET